MRALTPLRDEDTPPALFRWGGLALGVILISDAIRRFFIPGSRWDLYGFLIYLFLGVFCLVLSGYRRAFLLDERGLVRETVVWGRGMERLLLSWDDMTGLSWDLEPGGRAFARLSAPGVAWRLRLSEDQERNFAEWAERRRPDLAERLSCPEMAK